MLGYSLLVIGLNELLLLKGKLLEELLDTSVGDVLDHLLRERRGLLGRDGLDDLTGLLSLLWSRSNPWRCWTRCGLRCQRGQD